MENFDYSTLKLGDHIYSELTNEDKKKLALELGDVFYYLCQCANDINFPMDSIIQMNMAKIRKRRAEGTLTSVDRDCE